VRAGAWNMRPRARVSPRRIMPVTRAHRAAAAVLAALGAMAAAGAEPEPFPGTLAVRAGRLVASADLAAALPARVERQLKDGLGHVVTLHLAVVSLADGEAVAVYGREVDVLWDVWEERFHATEKGRDEPSGRALRFRDWPGLRAFLAEARDVDLASAQVLEGGRFAVVARLEVDPMSPELVARTRELIAHPEGGARADGGPPSVLGAVAGALLRPSAASGAALFRSAPFAVRDGALR